MKGFCNRIAPQAGLVALCLATAGCGLSNKITSAFNAPLNVTAPVQTSPGNFTVTADDASAATANAAALQQASAFCAALGTSSHTVNSSTTSTNGRHSFTLDFQCY